MMDNIKDIYFLEVKSAISVMNNMLDKISIKLDMTEKMRKLAAIIIETTKTETLGGGEIFFFFNENYKKRI